MRVRVALNAGNVHVLDLEPGTRLSQVEEAVVRLENIDRATHRVRLIASGKLLSDPTALVDQLVTDGSSFIHCAVSEHPPPPAPPPSRRPRNASRSRSRRAAAAAAASPQTQQGYLADVVIHHLDGSSSSSSVGGGNQQQHSRPYRHLYQQQHSHHHHHHHHHHQQQQPHPLADGPSDHLEARVAAAEARLLDSGDDGVVALPILHTVDENGDVRIIIPSLTLRGFDRLRDAGFSDAEISAIRRQFRIARGTAPALLESDDVNGDPNIDLDVEEAWLNSSGDDGSERQQPEPGVSTRSRTESRIVVTNSAEGSNTDFLLGCVCGYLIGILTLALLLDKNISRRWRVGIAAGIATNCAFGFLRSSLYVQSGSFSAT